MPLGYHSDADTSRMVRHTTRKTMSLTRRMIMGWRQAVIREGATPGKAVLYD
jgi:hypothetical protein